MPGEVLVFLDFENIQIIPLSQGNKDPKLKEQTKAPEENNKPISDGATGVRKILEGEKDNAGNKIDGVSIEGSVNPKNQQLKHQPKDNAAGLEDLSKKNNLENKSGEVPKLKPDSHEDQESKDGAIGLSKILKTDKDPSEKKKDIVNNTKTNQVVEKALDVDIRKETDNPEQPLRPEYQQGSKDLDENPQDHEKRAGSKDGAVGLRNILENQADINLSQDRERI
eukprot:TRINITY_DN17320_c0_g1_i1.p1 TRINITY_DN17320_c0_g1~~TRINITY_DN17320_c0_g1_i1.p1  ORF type:complete len:224 (-),score=70.85 TRINITY_DN17320_c0_g1_i1:1350-2021(-)